MFESISTSALQRENYNFDSRFFSPNLITQRNCDIFDNNFKMAQRDFLCDDYEDLLFPHRNSYIAKKNDFITPNSKDEGIRPILDEILNF